MNLTPEANPLPPPAPVTPAAPKRHRWPIIIAVVGTVAGVAGVIMAINGDNDLEATVAAMSTEAPAPAGESSGSPDAGTGNDSVDLQLVDSIWESSGKAMLCPAFNEAKAALPSMSDEDVFDMGLALADDLDAMTPAQVERMRELVLSDC